MGEAVTETEEHIVLVKVLRGEGLCEIHPEAETEPLSVPQGEGLTVVVEE
jgi:hypothetical protein